MRKTNLKFKQAPSGEKNVCFSHVSRLGLFVFGDGMKTCSVVGCGRKYYAKDYCERHYDQVRAHGKILKRTIYDPNKIIIKGDIAEIVLYNRKCQEVARAIIDTEDVEKIKEYKWFLGLNGYAQTHLKENIFNIEHIIMGIDKEQLIDHKNRNPLNNCKTNLRPCTCEENNRNVGKRKDNTSGFKGVSWHKQRKKWQASISVNQNRIYLGIFKDKCDAAAAYNEAALKYHSEFAYQNEI